MPNLCIIPSRALDDPEMSLKQLRALLAIGTFTQRDGSGVWASNGTLAERARLDERDLRRAITDLEERGYVRRTRRLRPNGATATSVLDILLDAPVGRITPPEEGQITPGEVGLSAPPNDPEERPTYSTTTPTPIGLVFPSPEQQTAYLSYRRAHRNPAALDAGLRALVDGMTTGQPVALSALGQALVDLAANGELFNLSRVRGYLRKQQAAQQVEGAPGAPSTKRLTPWSLSEADLAWAREEDARMAREKAAQQGVGA